MKYSFTMSALAALAAASPMLQVGTIHNDAAPILSSTQSKEIADSYMIVFKKHVKHEHTKDHHDWVQSIHTKSQSDRMELRKRSQFPVTTDVFEGLKHTYNIAGGILGYSGHFDEETIEAIRRHPDVSSQPSLIHREHIRCTRRFSRAPASFAARARPSAAPAESGQLLLSSATLPQPSPSSSAQSTAASRTPLVTCIPRSAARWRGDGWGLEISQLSRNTQSSTIST